MSMGDGYRGMEMGRFNGKEILSRFVIIEKWCVFVEMENILEGEKVRIRNYM